MTIDRRKVEKTTQDASLDGLKVDDLRAIASEGATSISRRQDAVKASKAKAVELLPGLEVTEFQATLPIEIYGELFKDQR